MKNYIIRFFILSFISLSIWSCSKQLNVYPTTSVVDGNVITDDASAQTTLNGVYYRFADAGADYNLISSIKWSDENEGRPSELASLFTYPYGGSEFSDHTYGPTNYYLPPMWSYGFAIVNAANGFLKNITPVTTIKASVKQRMMAESKFLRAFGNSYLLLFFSEYNKLNSAFGNILRNEFVTPDNINIARSSVSDTYDSIIADIDNAIEFLPESSTQPWFANIWTAKLLKARVLINRGDAGDYEEVISLTDDIINHSSFTLEENTKDIFLSKGLSSNEVMLGVQPYTTPAQNYKYSNYIFNANDVPTDAMISLFENDPRKDWTMAVVTSPYNGDILSVTKYYPGSLSDISPQPITEFSYAFRLTEAYLLEAEAICLFNGNLANAKTLLEIVMGHAGITDFSEVEAATTAEELQVLVVKEEMKNFVGEAGQDWFAVRRLPFATLQTLIPTINVPEQLVLPIPQTEITANANMKQNPGY